MRILNRSLFSISPGVYATFSWIHARQMSAAFSYISDKITSSYKYHSPWATYYTVSTLQKAPLDDIFEFDSYGNAIMIGGDKSYGNYRIGIVLSNIYSNIFWKEYGHGNINSIFGSLYQGYYSKDTIFEFGASFGYSWEKVNRIFFIPNNDSFTTVYARSRPRASFFSLHYKSNTLIPQIKNDSKNSMRTILCILADYHLIENRKINEKNGLFPKR